MQIDTLFDRIQEVLREVGTTLLAMRTQGVVQGTWHGTQLKSQADLIAEKLIVGRLRLLTPTLPVVSEEDLSSQSIKGLARYWLVDPVDGTASFFGGYSGFVTQVALVEGSKPVFGAVYAPAIDHMYFAEEGSGASLNGRKMTLNWNGGDVVLTDNYPEPRGIAKRLYEQLPCASYLESGSIGLKICLVASGQADVFVKDVRVRDWDLAPGHLILLESGGILTDLSGRNIEYGGDMEQNRGLIVAASGNLGFVVKNILAKETKHVC